MIIHAGVTVIVLNKDESLVDACGEPGFFEADIVLSASGVVLKNRFTGIPCRDVPQHIRTIAAERFF